MINPINTGAVLPFFLAGSDSSRQASRQESGFQLKASNTNLIPFIFWLDTTPDTVLEFRVLSMTTGLIVELDTALINRRRRTDLSRTWYFFNGDDISEVLPCGVYKIQVSFLLTTYESDEIKVVEARGGEYFTLGINSCAANILTLGATDTISKPSSSVIGQTLSYKLSDSSNWVNVSPFTTSPYTFQLDIGSITVPTDGSLLIRREVATQAGGNLVMEYSLRYTNADPCGTASLFFLRDLSTYTNDSLWYLEFFDSIGWGDKIYEDSFVERIYFDGNFDFPEQEREEEVLTDNQGNQVLNTANTIEYQVMVMGDLADSSLFVLGSIGDYSDISIVNNSAGVQGDVISPTFSSSPDTAGIYSRGRLRYIDRKYFETACTEAENTVAL